MQRRRAAEPRRGQVEPLACAVEARRAAQRAAVARRTSSAPQPRLARRGREFGGRGRRRRAQVGAEVGDGEVGLVAHAADQRHRAAARWCARQRLVVEGPQVLDRAAAAHQQDHVDRRLRAAGRATAVRATSSAGARRPAPRPAPAPPERAARAARSAVTTSCSAAAPSEVTMPMRARQRRQRRACARRRTGLRPRASPCSCRNCSNSAPCPARRMLSTTSCRSPRGSYTRQPAAHLDLFAIARREVQQAGRAPEHGAAQIWPARVLQREVAVAAGGARKARNLAAHRDRVEARLQRVSDRAAQRADLPDARRQRRPRLSRSANAAIRRGPGQLVHSAAACTAPRVLPAVRSARFCRASH